MNIRQEQLEVLELLCASSPGRGCILNALERRICIGLCRKGMVDWVPKGKERIYRATEFGRSLFKEGKMRVYR